MVPLAVDISETLNSFFDELFAWLPRVAGAIAVLIVAYVVARVLAALTRRVLTWAGLDRLAESRYGEFIQRVTASPSRLLGSVVFWVLVLGGIAIAAEVLGVQPVEDAVAAVYGYVPDVIAAMFIVIIAGLLASWAGTLVARLTAGRPISRLLATVAQVLILSVGAFMALDQLEIAGNIVVITYASLMGSVALGMALAFGLGGRDVAREVLRGAYDRGRKAIAAPPAAEGPAQPQPGPSD